MDFLTVIQHCLAQTLFAFVWVELVRGGIAKQNAPDNRGTEFVIGYMENLGQDIDVELFITTMRRANVSVEIMAPHFEAAGIHDSFNVSYGMVKQVHFPNNIRVVGSSKDTKGVLIKSNDEIVIYGVNKEKFSCDAFLGLPVDVLGTEYYVVTYYPPSNQCEMLIVGVDNNTAVTVRLGDALGDYTVRWDGYYYRKGDEIDINLNSFDTFQLVSKGDLSGSRVTSDKPVSVFSGNKKTKIGRGFSSDHIVEHLTPVTTWGKKFVTVPIPRRTVGDYFRFLASEDNTKVQISGGYTDTLILNKAGDFVQKNIPSNAYCLVTSNKAIFVAQFVQSQTSRLEPSDPSMIIIPPIEQFASDYTFATPKYSFGSYLNYFLFIIKAKDRPGLRLNGRPFPSNVRFNQVPGTEYVGGYISIPEGSHNVRHVSPISIFGGYLYGRATMESYGFPTGMRMAPINTPCLPTPTVVGDGLDNDCDGLIDEELCVLDSKDNDGDGNRNEDCAMPAPVDGNWSKWQSWDPCSARCRRKGHPVPTGSRTRRRTCTNPAPAHDGDICVGKDSETSSCQPTSFCPIDGHWSRWGKWNSCSIQCKRPGEETGTKTRHRHCSNPSPKYGGKHCKGHSRQKTICTPSTFCPVDGKWASWEGWTACSLTCLKPGSVANGVHTRSRSCVNPKPEHGGKHCPGEDEDIQDCSLTNLCPVDGKWASWEGWTACSLTCLKPGSVANGVHTRSRSCVNPKPEHGGKHCPGEDEDIQDCSPTNPCPDAPDNRGTEFIIGYMENLGQDIDVALFVIGNVDGKWASWEGWTVCSLTCLKPGSVANGVQTRSRSCVNPKPEYGGKHCPGEDEDIQDCSLTNPCPDAPDNRGTDFIIGYMENLGQDIDVALFVIGNVDGKWASWEGWTACSLTCLKPGSVANGVHTRSRSCVNPKPEHGGKHCPGEDEDIHDCSPTNPCPVDGKWASWEGWTACSLTCLKPGSVANGVQTRSRSCVNPKPEHGGKHCPGEDEDIQDCSLTNPCPDAPDNRGTEFIIGYMENLGQDIDVALFVIGNVDGKWASWEGWTACSLTCLKPGSVANGVQTRSRSCVNPKPEHGGKHCPGEDEDIQDCSLTNPCPERLPEVGWSAWSTCSAQCGGGIRKRQRPCDNQSQSSCHGDHIQEDTCNTRECVVDGKWASWEGWTACSLTCLKPGSVTNGVQTRSRSCVNPKPEHGGKHCPGEGEDIQDCSPTNPCPERLPEVGWSAWSTCSAQCDGGIRKRQRPCDSQSQSSCHGDHIQEDTCNTQECVGTMIELETKQQSPPHFTYTKLTDYGFRPDADKSIIFHVKACNDAHVALISNDLRVYEVIIGGWSNTKSIIRTSRDGKPKASNNGTLLSCSRFKTFNLSWNDGLVVLHRNSSKGWVKVIEWQNPNPKTVTNIAFTTGLWATGAWRFRGLAMCNCLVSGDPHYTTFDGEQVDIMGTCKYMLSEYRKPGDMCAYAVEVKNERRGSNSKVSYTRLVDVKMFGKVIRLHQERNVYIDGELTYLPYRGARFEVVISGTYVRFASKCGLVVEFDGVSNAWVRVPSQLGEACTGICGNCNGHKDDRRPVEVYQVADDSDLKFQHCMTDSHFNPCSRQVKKEAETNSICKFLNPSNAEVSPFKTCIEKNPNDAMIKFESCVYDFCAYRQESNASLDTKLCDGIAAFADSCLTNGYKIKWRSANFCPLQCGDHAMYNPEGSACPPTCIDPEASRKCTLGTLEGCECEDGYLLSNRKCVKASECGCLDGNGKYYPIGTTFSADCTTVKQCKVQDGDIKLVVVNTLPACGHNAECGDKDGDHTCVCKRGYQGDPTNSCHPVYECRDDVSGTIYQGTVSQTAHGNDCLPWNTSNSKFKSIGGHRFCRNPNADQRLSPWCYVHKGHVTSWEYCDIPMCDEEKPVCEATTEVTCSSSGNAFILCRVEQAMYITYIGLIRRTSTAGCRNGFSFGRFGDSLWTDHGCGGHFDICFTPKQSVYNITAPPKKAAER